MKKFWNWIKNIFRRLFYGPSETIIINQPPPSVIIGEDYESTPKEEKYALLVAINEYEDSSSNLKGCIYDAENMRDILINLYNFKPENIRVVTDERATKKGILERLNWLVNHENSHLFFQYSGHGAQVVDRNGDELDDGLDEILCPHDMDWDDPLTDDILHSYFLKIPKSSSLFMVCDSCHSGTITRNSPSVETKPRCITAPFDILSRSLNRQLPIYHIGDYVEKLKTMNMPVVSHISGCMDHQVSMDAYLEKKWQGAMTWALTTAIKNNPNATWVELHKEASRLLKLNRFTQDPNIMGFTSIVNKKPFA